MAGVKLSCSGGPKPFPRIVKSPDVEVADLGSFWGADAYDCTSGDFPSAPGSDGQDK